MIMLRFFSCLIISFFLKSVLSYSGMPITDQAIIDECMIRYQLNNNPLPACLDVNCDALPDPSSCKDFIDYHLNSLDPSRRRSEITIPQIKKDQSLLFNPISKQFSDKKFSRRDGVDVQIVESRSIITGKNSTEVSEWDPITDIIGQGETKYYQFNVNTTSTGFSQYYNILIFLSGNICTLPNSIGNDNQLFVYYSFNDTLFSDKQSTANPPVIFSDGYFEALAKYNISNENDQSKKEKKEGSEQITLYIKVSAPSTSNPKDIWNYQFGISQNDLIYQWDEDVWITNVDSDANSALFIFGNFTSDNSIMVENNSNNKSAHNYELYVYPGESNNSYFKGLSHSWCAVKNGPSALRSIENMESSLTNRSDMLRQQFYISNLNDSSSYVSFAVYNSKQGGIVFKSGTFETMTSNACKVIYNLDFCENVAYAVPNMKVDDLKSYYDENSKAIFQNFTKALDQVPCNIEQDASYSPLKTCLDCSKSYRDWLCSVTIPRCTTDKRDMYKLREVNESRLPFINNFLPYYEILPCYNQCESIVRDCPAQLGFSCPNNGSSLGSDYYWDVGASDYISCNFVGNITVLNLGLKTVMLNSRILIICLFLVVIVTS